MNDELRQDLRDQINKTKCVHIDLDNIFIEIYTVFVESDQCCHDICEKCFIESNSESKNSPNNEASYVVLNPTWEF